jgi:hypothetical protein
VKRKLIPAGPASFLPKSYPLECFDMKSTGPAPMVDAMRTETSTRVNARALACLLSVFVLLGGVAAQKDAEEPVAALTFLILKDDSGKPVRSAAVILHPVNTRGKQSRGGMELKTDAEGKTSFDDVPYGTLRVQVLASGFQTYGEDYNIDRAKIDLVIKLKRPQGQYSIYGNQPGDKKDNTAPPPDPNAKPQ